MKEIDINKKESDAPNTLWELFEDEIEELTPEEFFEMVFNEFGVNPFFQSLT